MREEFSHFKTQPWEGTDLEVFAGLVLNDLTAGQVRVDDAFRGINVEHELASVLEIPLNFSRG